MRSRSVLVAAALLLAVPALLAAPAASGPRHRDLNVVGGVNCVPGGSSFNDLNGHGTHVSGIAAAKDNHTGVVGVAPGARLWAVRVLDSQGNGLFSTIICGIDWVTAHADVIQAAN